MSDKVKRWWPILDRWCVELGVSQSLVLAVIHMESGGNENARRYEPAFEKRYILGSSAWLKRCKELGISTRDAATSYGLMQLMFTTAWGYGCRSVEQILDPGQNIRFSVAHLASLLDRCGSKEAALAAYNGGMGAVTDIKNGVQTTAARYSRNVMALYNRYRDEALLERPVQTEHLPTAQRNYFAPSELACPCCGLNRTKPELLEMLNMIREAIGKPLEVNSSTRCAKHNEDVGGVPNSSHTTGEAADIRCRSITPPELRKVILRMWRGGGLPHLAGLGSYRTFTHVDIAPKVAGRLRIWNG